MGVLYPIPAGKNRGWISSAENKEMEQEFVKLTERLQVAVRK
jgi:hypothetical protein